MTDLLRPSEYLSEPDTLVPGPVDGPISGPEVRQPRPRIVFLDHLRVFLTVLVVVHHVAVIYSDIPLFYYTESASDPSGAILDHLLLLNQAFFMGFFFLIAGYFVPGSYDRKGPRAFLRDRLVRLGIPLLAFFLFLTPILTVGLYPKLRAIVAEQGHDLPYWAFYLIKWSPGPLWFVEVLLVFCWVYVIFRKRRDARPAPELPEATPAVTWVPRPLEIVGFAMALAGVTYFWRILVPVGQYWPIVGLPTPGYLPQYASLFAIGAMAYRRGWLLNLPTRTGWFGLALALVALAVLGPVTLGAAFQGSSWVGHGTWRSLAYALWDSTFAVGVIVALLVLFRECLNIEGRPSRFLAEHCYTVYIIHPFVLVALGHALAWLHAIAVVKFAIVTVIAIPCCWVTAALVRSLPYARRVL
jgi:peptidoglycan/LPS O-acetylase OafA/YrhL